jgi:hypothetical protein
MEQYMRDADTIVVASVRTIGMISEEDETQWNEIEVTVQYQRGGRVLGVESLPFLRFKQLVREADRRGLAVEYINKPESNEKSCASCEKNIDVVTMARELLKVEKDFFDPAII